MFKIFDIHQGLTYGMSQKNDGPMELASSLNAENLEFYLKQKQLNIKNLVRAGLVHQGRTVKVGKTEVGQTITACDALVTSSPGVILSVTVADCYPVYFFEPESKTIALAHSGWRGSISQLFKNVISKMSCAPEKILVGVGPGIGECHFEITNDIIENFADFTDAISRISGKIYVNLPKIIQSQLIKSGILPKNLEFLPECTFCNAEKYYSFRRDKPTKIQAMVAYIQIN